MVFLKASLAIGSQEMTFTVSGKAAIAGNVDISLPALILARNDETLAINGGELTGRIDFSRDGYAATRTKLALAHPRMDLSWIN